MYVIAGATGHIGSVAAAKLLDAKEKVRVFVRDAKKASALTARGAEVAVGSLDDAAALEKAFSGAKGAFVLLPPNMAAPDFRAWQRTAGEAIAAAVQKSKIPHVVLLSSVGGDVDGPTGPILGVHWLEENLKKTGAKATILRPTMFAENVLMVLPVAKAQGIYPNMGHPEMAVPMIATRDIAAQVARFLVEPPAKTTVVDILGPPITPAEVAATLGRVLGKDVKLVNVPEAGRAPGLAQAGMPPQLVSLFTEMYSAFDKGLLRPVGDQLVKGTTTLEEVLRANVQ